MNPSKSHPILAAFLDYYFVSLSLLTLLVVIQASVGRVFVNYTVLIVIFFFVLISDIVYHVWLNRKLTFLSYGERVIGRHLAEGKKVRANPYRKNRFFLFLVIVVSFLMIGNAWNGVIFLALKPTFIAGVIFKLFFIFLGAYLMGLGKRGGALIALIPFLIGAFFTFAGYRVSGSGIYLNKMIMFLALAAGLLICFFIYKKPKV